MSPAQRISMIVAASERGIIGRGGQLPWTMPADRRRFEALTAGHVMIVGRRTYEEEGRPLPGRRMIVVTRDPTLPSEVTTVATVDEAITAALRLGDDEIFVAGGAAIYAAALPRLDRIYLTRVHGEVAGDTKVPMLDGGVPSGFAESRPPEPLDPTGATHAATFHVYDAVAARSC